MPTRRSTEERFWSKVSKPADPGGSGSSSGSSCWAWNGPTWNNGYGKFWTFHGPGGTVPAHRWAYEQARGAVPEGLELDHLCRNRACVRPDHLEPVTRRENVLRGQSPTALAHNAGTCLKGHAMTPENRIERRGASPLCRACAEENIERRRAQKREAQKAYLKRHPEKAREWREKNIETVRANARAYWNEKGKARREASREPVRMVPSD